MRAIQPKRPPPSKKKRSPVFLLVQIIGGGGVGILIALIILKVFGAGYFGRGNDGPVGISEDREVAGAPPKTNPPPRKEVPPKNSTNKPTSKPVVPSTKPPVEIGSNPPPIETKPPSNEKPSNPLPAKKERTPLSKEAVGEFFAQAKLSPATHYWFAEQGAFEFDQRGGFAFTPRSGAVSIYWPAAFTAQYLELDNEAHNERIRLYVDHAESAKAPFEKFETLYAAGKWIVTADQTGIDWFPKAIAELDSISRQSRVTAKDYMIKLFGAADKLKTANKLKDIPFGFDLPAERERFNTTGLVPWTAPLLPMTAEYVQECRKMHKNEEAAYNRIALRLSGQREKLARDFLEYHQWRNARAWPLAILAWNDETGAEVRQTLLSNGAVNDEASKNTWKITGDILDVATGAKRVRLKIHPQGKEFSMIGADSAVNGKFVFEGVRIAY